MSGQLDLSTKTIKIFKYAFDQTARDSIAAHLADLDNPHEVTKADVGLGNADNTSDADKPLSDDAIAALAAKAPLASPALTGTPTAPTAATGDVSTQIATAALAQAKVNVLGAVVTALDAVVDAHIADTADPHNVTKDQVGLGNADNTSDANKPVSTAQQTALNLKANIASPTFTGVPSAPTAALGTDTTQIATTEFVADAAAVLAAATAAVASDLAVHEADTNDPHNVTAAQVGLGNVTNTSDADKPVSTAQQTALNLKANLASPALTGVPTAPTAGPDTNSTQVATTAFVATAAVAVAGAPERPGDAVGLYGTAVTGAPSGVARVDDGWVVETSAGSVVRVTGGVADDPQIITPVAAFPLEAGFVWELRYKVQRQVDPGDPLNDSVSLKIRWLVFDKTGVSGGGGTTTIEDIALTIADGIQERSVRVALAAGEGVDYAAPAGTIYFRPFIELFGGDHVTDVIVISARPVVASLPVITLDKIILAKQAADPVAGPGLGLAVLYVVADGDTATLRMQAGTDATPIDIVVGVGSGF